eukprot:7993055-Pyramimonas_sp.AAC.1
MLCIAVACCASSSRFSRSWSGRQPSCHPHVREWGGLGGEGQGVGVRESAGQSLLWWAVPH